MNKNRLTPPQPTPQAPPSDEAGLLKDLRKLIEEARRAAAVAVNAEITLLYWRVGQRINHEVLRGGRASYGEQIVNQLADRLTQEYGRGFSAKSLRHMMRFAEVYPESEIVSPLARQLSWSHILELIYLKDSLARHFYAEMATMERWSRATLRNRIGSLMFERTALAAKPDEQIQQELETLGKTGELTPEILLKDPYVLDFLGLTDRFLERDVEDAILRELESFLLELGAGFTFVARQKRIQLDNDDFYIDLLFYNRKLRRLVAIDLKIDDFKAEYKGQMELYLRWLAKYDQEPGDASPLGIILCTGKKREQIELLELGQSGIHVAEYLTVLPPRAVFEEKVHKALLNARARIENTFNSSVDPKSEKSP